MEGSNLQAFKNTVIRPWGYEELMVNLEEGRDTMNIDSQLLDVPYRSVYNCLLERPFAETLDTITSLVHLKLKNYNLYDGSVTVKINLYGAKRVIGIYNKIIRKEKLSP